MPRSVPLVLLLAGVCVLGGCGPLAIGAAASSALKKDHPDLTDPIVEILSEQGSSPPPAFKLGEPVVLLLRTNKRNVRLRSWLEVEPLQAQPDVNGCPRDFRGDDIERFGTDAEDVDPLTLTLPFEIDDAQLAAAGIDTSVPFSKEVRLWVRGTDAQGRVLCASHAFRIDRVPPSAPKSVAVVARDPHELVVNWQPSPEADVAGYLVVWDVPMDGSAPIATTPYDVSQRVKGSGFNNLVDPGAPLPGPEQDANGLHVAGRTTATAVIRGLYAMRPHFVTVRAVDAAGNLSPLDNNEERDTRTRAGGDGRFVVAGTIGGFDGPMVIADFDGDRLPDVASVERSPDALLVHFALTRVNGRAVSFEDHEVDVATYLSVNASLPYQLTAADFDHDGRADLAAFVPAANFVALRTGPVGPDGAPTLSVASTATNFNAVGLRAADVDRDGRVDLVPMLRCYECSPNETDAVALLRGAGDLTFAYRETPFTNGAAIGESTGEYELADYDGDSIVDVAAIQSASIAVVLFNRDGSYRAVRRASTNGIPRHVAVGDFNGDGKADLAVRNSDGKILILEGDGTGHLAPGATLLLDDGAAGPLATGDFDADGILDLAVGGAGGVTILLGTGAGGRGDGGFKVGETVSLGFAPERILVADIDGDRILDLVADKTLLLGRGASGRGLTGFQADFQVLETGRFLEPVYGLGGFTGSLVIDLADLDRDGIQDLVVSRGLRGTLVVYRGLGTDAQGSATFGDPATFFADPTIDLQWIAAGKFTADRFPDVVGSGALFPGRGDGSLEDAVPFQTLFGRVVAADLDLDGLDDICAEGSVVFMNGDGTTEAAGTTDFAAPIAGDFDGDGLPDVLDGPRSFSAVHLGQRDADGYPARSFNAVALSGIEGYEAVSADFNGDGRSDLATVRSHEIRIYHAAAGATPGFQLAQGPFGGFPVNYVEAADFNGDGFEDLITMGRVFLAQRDAGGGPTGTFETVGIGTPLDTSIGSISSLGATNDRLRVADLNSDGVPDLVVTTGGVDVNFDTVVVHLGTGTILDR